MTRKKKTITNMIAAKEHLHNLCGTQMSCACSTQLEMYQQTFISILFLEKKAFSN